MLTAEAFQDTRHKLLTAKEQCGMKISYIQKINRACLYSYLIRYQTLILPVHIKSQLSYAVITEKFCIRKLYNLWKNSKKARLKKSTKNANGFTIMAKLSWRSTKLSPGAGFLSIFFAPGTQFRKNFLPGSREFDYLKKIPRGSAPGGVGAWMLLTDA